MINDAANQLIFLIILRVKPDSKHAAFWDWESGTLAMVLFDETKEQALHRASQICALFRYEIQTDGKGELDMVSIGLPQTAFDEAKEPYKFCFDLIRYNGGGLMLYKDRTALSLPKEKLDATGSPPLSFQP